MDDRGVGHHKTSQHEQPRRQFTGFPRELRPSPPICAMLRQSLADAFASFCGKAAALCSSSTRPYANSSSGSTSGSPHGRTPHFACSVISALLRGGTLQCYARLLAAALGRMREDERQPLRPGDPAVRDAWELLSEVARLLGALAAAVRAAGSAAGAPTPACTSPSTDAGSAPGVARTCLPALLSSQLASSGLLEHMAAVLLTAAAACSEGPVGGDVGAGAAGTQVGDKQQCAADVMRAVAHALEATAGSQDAKAPPSALASGPAVQWLLLCHAFGLAEKLEGRDAGSSAAGSPENAPAMEVTRWLPVWNEAGRPLPGPLPQPQPQPQPPGPTSPQPSPGAPGAGTVRGRLAQRLQQRQQRQRQQQQEELQPQQAAFEGPGGQDQAQSPACLAISAELAVQALCGWRSGLLREGCAPGGGAPVGSGDTVGGTPRGATSSGGSGEGGGAGEQGADEERVHASSVHAATPASVVNTVHAACTDPAAQGPFVAWLGAPPAGVARHIRRATSRGLAAAEAQAGEVVSGLQRNMKSWRDRIRAFPQETAKFVMEAVHLTALLDLATFSAISAWVQQAGRELQEYVQEEVQGVVAQPEQGSTQAPTQGAASGVTAAPQTPFYVEADVERAGQGQAPAKGTTGNTGAVPHVLVRMLEQVEALTSCKLQECRGALAAARPCGGQAGGLPGAEDGSPSQQTSEPGPVTGLEQLRAALTAGQEMPPGMCASLLGTWYQEWLAEAGGEAGRQASLGRELLEELTRVVQPRVLADTYAHMRAGPAQHKPNGTAGQCAPSAVELAVGEMLGAASSWKATRRHDIIVEMSRKITKRVCDWVALVDEALSVVAEVAEVRADQVQELRRAAGSLPSNRGALHLLCVRLARAGGAQWSRASSERPPRAGPGAEAGPWVRGEQLGRLVCVSLGVARDALCLELHRCEEQGRPVLPALLLRRLAEWWEAACAALTSATSATSSPTHAWLDTAGDAGSSGGGGNHLAPTSEATWAQLCALLAPRAAASRGGSLVGTGAPQAADTGPSADVASALSAGIRPCASGLLLASSSSTQRAIASAKALAAVAHHEDARSVGSTSARLCVAPSLALQWVLVPLLSDPVAASQLLRHGPEREAEALVRAAAGALSCQLDALSVAVWQRSSADAAVAADAAAAAGQDAEEADERQLMTMWKGVEAAAELLSATGLAVLTGSAGGQGREAAGSEEAESIPEVADMAGGTGSVDCTEQRPCPHTAQAASLDWAKDPVRRCVVSELLPELCRAAAALSRCWRPTAPAATPSAASPPRPAAVTHRLAAVVSTLIGTCVAPGCMLPSDERAFGPACTARPTADLEVAEAEAPAAGVQPSSAQAPGVPVTATAEATVLAPGGSVGQPGAEPVASENDSNCGPTVAAAEAEAKALRGLRVAAGALHGPNGPLPDPGAIARVRDVCESVQQLRPCAGP